MYFEDEDQSTVLTNANLVFVDQGVASSGQAVWIEGDRIRKVGDEAAIVAEASDVTEARIVDLEGEFLLPGLFNLHTHFGLVHSSGIEDRSPAARVLRMAANAGRCLRAGVTTVRLVGEYDHTDFDLRDAIEKRLTPGPNIRTAGQILCCTGGHGSSGGGLEADGPSEFARAVRRQVTRGADVIKVAISGGIGGLAEEAIHSQLSDDELSAVIDTAHGWNRKVTAHAGSPDAIRRAVNLGLDGVEHGYNLDDAAIKSMAENGTWLVPTLIVSRAEEFYRNLGAPEFVIRKAMQVKEPHFESVRAAIAAGVKVALGTDMLPNQPFEGTTATARELEFLVDAGLSPAEALGAATVSAAEYLGILEQTGSIAPGKLADLITVEENPLIAISAIRNLRSVWKSGHRVQPTPNGVPPA